MKSFLRILGYARAYSGSAILNIIFNIISIVFSLASLVMITPFLQILFGTQKPTLQQPEISFSVDSLTGYFNYTMSNVILSYGKIEALVFICLLVIVIFFIKNFFRYFALFFMAVIRNGTVRDIRHDLFKKITVLPLSFYSNERKGDVITRLTSDVQEVEWSIMSTLEVTFREPITVIVYLSAMLIMSPHLTLFVLIMLPIAGVLIGWIGKTLKKESVKAQSKLSELLTFIDESLSGLKIIKAFNAQGYQIKKFAALNDQHFKIMTGILRRRELSSPLTEFLGIAVVVIVLWFGGRLVLNFESSLKPEIFINFIVIFSQLIPSFKSFASAFYLIQKGVASSDRIVQILDRDIEIREKVNPERLHEFKTDIEYRNVSFAYEKENVLENININVKRGKAFALFGPSGAGKSTLADLVMRFYDPTEGQVLIDGVDLKDLKISDLRDLIGVVTQDSILFNDTVFNNIAFNMDNPSDEEVINAAKVANAHEFIVKLEKGYETNIGDSGNKLSGGQKQRLSIARAILKNPPILILDEATSALDAESEKLVQDAIFNLMKNRTSIVIAHRLSTILYADEIVVLQHGKIVERGDHEGLMSKGGVYKKLVELQAF